MSYPGIAAYAMTKSALQGVVGLSINVRVTLYLLRQVGLLPLWAKLFGIGTALFRSQFM